MAERASRLQASVCAEQTKPHKRENLCKQPQLRGKPKTGEAVGEMTDEVTGELRCGYYQRGECRSCALIDLPYASQIAQKSARAAELVPADKWLLPATSQISQFRNKVKLVVSGNLQKLKLGIADQDLRDCPLPTCGIRATIPVLAEFVKICELTPYNFKTNTGVLKYILITESPTGELMVRFVVRRRGVQGIIFKRYNWLERQLPQLRVCSINVQPERKAIIEGDEEILVSEQAALSMPLNLRIDVERENGDSGRNALISAEKFVESRIADGDERFSKTGTGDLRMDFTLSLQPKSFFQTNTEMAQALYSRAATWIYRYLVKAKPAASSEMVGAELNYPQGLQIWDLYCGVGGFAFAGALAAQAVMRSSINDLSADCLTVAEAPVLDQASVKSVEHHRDAVSGSALRGDVTICGVETSLPAVAGANQAAQAQGLPAQFFAADALSWAKAQLAEGVQPEIIIVNPPRRGIGQELAVLLNGSGAERIIYSSCNVQSLAKDLRQMSNYVVEQAQLIDIFPHTAHFETACLLSRK